MESCVNFPHPFLKKKKCELRVRRSVESELKLYQQVWCFIDFFLRGEVFVCWDGAVFFEPYLFGSFLGRSLAVRRFHLGGSGLGDVGNVLFCFGGTGWWGGA